MVTFLTGLLGGFIAWIGTTVIGQPICKFLELRTEAARIIARYDPYVASSPYVPYPDPFTDVEWLEERKRAYLTCGVNLRAYAATHGSVVRWLHKFRYYPDNAGIYLIALGYLLQESELRHPTRDSAVQSLRLTFDI
jgi:hypothetical protein